MNVTSRVIEKSTRHRSGAFREGHMYGDFPKSFEKKKDSELGKVILKNRIFPSKLTDGLTVVESGN